MNSIRIGIRSGALLAALLLWTGATRAVDDPAVAAKEAQLIQLLQSGAPAQERAVACKQLAVYGSARAVPELAKLLADPQLASWARIALEAIPGSEADEALRQGLEGLQGELLVGTINSLGVRRPAAAVDTLTSQLKNADPEVASAAALALGRIGNNPATAALRGALATAPAKVRRAVAEGCILCAERCLAEGRAEEAAAIYDAVRQTPDMPRQSILEATRGAILSRKEEGVELLAQQLRSSDRDLFRLGLSAARELSGPVVSQTLADEMVSAAPDRGALIVQALADRQDTSVLPAVLKGAASGPKPVRLAAISALERLGDASCLSKLMDIALEADDEVAGAAKSTLAGLSGDKIDSEILARLSKATGKSHPLLIEIVGQRRIDALPLLLKVLDHADRDVRKASLKALGETIDRSQLSVLITQVVKPRHPDDAATAQQALRAACLRMPERDECAQELTAAMERLPVATKINLLNIQGAMGGTKALESVAAAARTTDDKLQDASSRLLGEWMTADAAPVLLDLAKTANGDKYQVRALRGYIRIARQFVLPDAQRTEMCQKAMAASQHVAEKKLVLDVLKRYPTMDNLKMAIQALKTAELKEEATAATLAIAQNLGSKGADIRELITQAGLEPVKVEIVKAEYGTGTIQKDVTNVLRQQVGDLPLISLTSPSYNTSFGGDPAPGTAKQLKIQYKINGKSSEVTLAENAMILLPMPK
ncbi:MAG: HEAT repeat domain-containing protein [Planctomycetales bacterium]